MKKEDSHRIVVHVDMDAFYAAVEQIDHPEYRNKPVVVGADPDHGKGRGVVSAASYEARKYGIHSAMPISRAYRLCPHAVYLRPRFKRYIELSKVIMKILYEFSPSVEQISIDEAFLDCTGTEKLFGSQEDLALQIKERIRNRTELTASVGVATNKSIAKIASELNKPNGLTVCPPGCEREFISKLPITYLWGVGKKTVERLKSLGFETAGDVARCPRRKLLHILGKYGLKLWDLANGIDNRKVKTSGIRKSISEEITFQRDVSEDRYIEHVLFEIADRLTRKMRKEGIKGKTVTMKLRLHDFDTYTRSHTLTHPVSDLKDIRSTALNLYRRFDRRDKKIRLVGIAVSNLEMESSGSYPQLELFSGNGEGDNKGRSIDTVLDKMKDLYGEKVTRAAFLPPSE